MLPRAPSVLLVTVLGSAPAFAAKPYEFAYDAPSTCPDKAAAIQRVSAYTPNAVVVERGGGIALSLEIADAGGTFVATVRARQPGQPEGTRTLPAASCEEVVGAAALLIALLVDPEGVRPVTPVAAVSPTPTGDLTVTNQVVAPPSPPRPAETLAPDERAAPPSAAPAPDERSDAERSGWTGGVAAQADVTWAVAPAASFGASVGPYAASPTHAALSPWLSLRFHFAASPLSEEAAGSVRFRLVAGRAVACPVRAWFGDAELWIGPCASLELGAYGALVSDARPSNDAAVLWAQGGLGTRTELALAPLFLSAELGAAFPLLRDSFRFAGGATDVHRIPGAAVEGSLGVGLSFW